MPKKTPQFKALLATKHDFVASLNNMMDKSMILDSIIRMVIEEKLVSNGPIAEKLQKYYNEWHDALFTPYDQD